MVKNFFISHVENDNILRGAIADINLLPDVEKAVYQSFQQKIKVLYAKEVDEARLTKDIIDVLHNHDDTIQVSQKVVPIPGKTDSNALLLYGMGLLVAGISYSPLIPGGWKWLGFLLALGLASKILLKKVYNTLILERHINESILILLAIIGAYLIKDYLEAILVLTIYLIANHFSQKGSVMAKQDVSKTLHKEATMVYKLLGKTVLPTPIKEIQEKDLIVVRPGEVIPLHSRVLEGESSIDMSPISNQNYEMDALPGVELRSGSVNLTKPLKLQVLKTYNEGLVKALITKTEEAMEQKKGFAKTSEKIGNTYVKAIGTLALVLLASSFFSGNPSQNIYKGLILLAVSTPWAMLISTPIAYNYALSLAKTMSILIKDIGSIDAIGKLSTLFFTKTGILTTGEYRVTEILPYKNTPEEHILTFAAIGEIQSRHPIGLAIRQANNKTLNQDLLEKYKEEKGKGTMAVYGGRNIIVGTEEFLLSMNVGVETDYQGLQVHVGVDGKYLGAIALEESIKPEGIRLISRLKALKLSRISVLTGDQKEAASETLIGLRLSSIHGDMALEDKVGRIRKEKKKVGPKTVGFIGDTISDGVAMAASDVSFAFLKGRLDRVTEIADVVLLKEDMNLIYETVHLGKRTYGIIQQNIAISLITKLLIIGYLLFAEVATGFMLLAIGIDLAVSLLTILNCFRITKGYGFLVDPIKEGTRNFLGRFRRNKVKEEEEDGQR